MNEPILHVLAETGDGGRLGVLAPKVGAWSMHPHPGALLGPGSPVGLLDHLNRRYALALPDGVAGRVSGGLPLERVVAVEYGQVLFLLEPLGAGDLDRLDGTGGAPGVPAGHGLPPGHHAVVAPTDGAFYRSPRPGAPPFVSPGDRVREGQPVGLVEVMKTFGQVLYGGPGLPAEAEVVEVRVEDGAEIRAGQVLVVVR
jgi:acetyl-CoA carboxylase biotin carboxyl carrier protein